MVCTAESIVPAQKKIISEAFKAPVLEEYGSTEFDIIAFECASGHLHLVNPWLLIESEDDSILITDVTRQSQSLVRYQLGDTVHMADSHCKNLGDSRIVDELRGRTFQQFAFINPDLKFHAVVFGRAISAYMEITGDFFKFTVCQVGYGDFDVFVSEAPVKGLRDLELWLKINLKSKLRLDEYFKINVIVGEVDFEGAKHTYFVQNL